MTPCNQLFVSVSLALALLVDPAASQWAASTLANPLMGVTLHSAPSRRMNKLKTRTSPRPAFVVNAVSKSEMGGIQSNEIMYEVPEEMNTEQEQGSFFGPGLAVFSALSALLVWGRQKFNASESSELKQPLLKNRANAVQMHAVETQSVDGTIGEISGDSLLVTMPSKEPARIPLRDVFQKAQIVTANGEKVMLRDLFSKNKNNSNKLGALRFLQQGEAVASMQQKFSDAKPAAFAALSNLVLTFPAHAEAGKLFDFNLTLPIIASEFLILLFILDKTMFGPVGKALDDRDELIRSQLSFSGSNADEVAELLAQKDQIIKEARSEISMQVAQLKTEMDGKISAESAKSKAEVDKQIAAAIAALDVEKEQSAKLIDSQAKKLSDEIIAKVVSV